MTKRRGGEEDTRPAQAYFQAIESLNRLEEQLTEVVLDTVGGTTSEYVDFMPYDDAVCVNCAQNSLSVGEEAQKKLFALGFKRIYIYHQNGQQTYYYEGGPTKGKYGPREK